MTDRELMQQALEALEWAADERVSAYDNKLGTAILALRERLAREEQEPVAWLWQHSETGRTRVVMPDTIITTDATWHIVGPLHLGTAPQPAVREVVHVEKDGTETWRKVQPAVDAAWKAGYKHGAWASQPAVQVPDAMKIVLDAMQSDPDYAWSWHCNVAMSFVDAGGDHYIANQGAARFMKLLANVEPAHELPTKQPAVREWQSLTEEEINAIDAYTYFHESPEWEVRFARAVEAKLKERNA